jgi:ABC-type glycerol-3-phosphate transport system substrate-binding protein
VQILLEHKMVALYRAGKPDFQGFVFEGKAGESLTCNALEWIYSYGGGSVNEPDKKVTINNPNAIKALDAAHSWIGTISFLRSCRMFSTTPWPGLQPSPGPITISCRRPFPKT